jgi:hypothetical protein
MKAQHIEAPRSKQKTRDAPENKTRPPTWEMQKVRKISHAIGNLCRIERLKTKQRRYK